MRSPFNTRDLDSRDNALNMLRLVLALLVVFSHAQILAGVGDGVVVYGQHLGSWAVVGFFGISGYLITGSRTRSNAGTYLINRVARIFPGFLVSLVFVALVLGPVAHVIEKGALDGYFSTPPTPLDFIYSNIFLRVGYYNIGTTLSQVPYPSAWNGSLWSLYYEFWCYIIIGVFMSWAFIRKRAWPTAFLFAVSLLAHAGIGRLNPYLGNNAELALLIFMLPYFLGGALIYQLRDRLPMRGWIAAIALVAAWVLIAFIPSFGKQAAAPALAYLVLYLGAVLPSPRIVQVHDVSYGVYIFHFPVIQLLILLGVNRLGFVPLLLIALALTLVLATASWFGIERAAMRWTRGKAPWADIRLGSAPRPPHARDDEGAKAPATAGGALG